MLKINKFGFMFMIGTALGSILALINTGDVIWLPPIITSIGWAILFHYIDFLQRKNTRLMKMNQIKDDIIHLLMSREED